MILHNDIDMPFAKADAEPVYLAQMKALLTRHPKTSIIWAHTGLGRVVHPASVGEAAERARTTSRSSKRCWPIRRCAMSDFDISWDEVAKYIVASPRDDRARGRR